MKLEKVCTQTKRIAEAEDTKQESRTKPSYFTRTRKMSFSELVYYILHPGKESTHLGLKRFFAMIGKEGCGMSEQAFSKARSHFSHWPFEKMVRETTEEEYRSEDVRTWNGYHLFAIDGTTVALPDKPSLCKAFGGSGRKKDSATASASILYDIENDWIADAAIDPYPTVERVQAMRHILRLKELEIASRSLVLFDQGYPEAKFLAFLQANGIRFLMRCKRKWNYVVDETQSNDFTLDLKGNVSLRVIWVLLPSGETETLITNLFDLPYEQFMPLYFRRWPVETKYDILKNKLELCNFTGCSPNAILQDFWASIHLANIAAVAKAEADQAVQASRASSGNKYTYQANTAQLIGTLKDRFIRACLLRDGRCRRRAIQDIIDEIACSVSPIRPNRSFWRNPWVQTSLYPYLWDGVTSAIRISFDSEVSQWSSPEIEEAYQENLIPDSLIGEDLTKNINRAEFAAVCVKVYENLSATKAIPAVTNPFTDCQDVEVLKAYNIGVINGIASDTFAPYELLNREQAATILTRVFKRVSMPGWTLATDSQFRLNYTKPTPFQDDGDISEYARESVYFMAANNIIGGIGNNLFAPRNITDRQTAEGYANATREQALVIALRIVKNLA